MNKCSPRKLSGVTALASLLFLLCTNLSHAAEFSLPLAAMESKATTYFVSPDGQGALNGSSESNAMPFAKTKELISELEGSAKLILLSGIYKLTDTVVLRSPSTNDVLILEGRDNAVIQGNFNFSDTTGTNSGLRLHTGNIIVRGLDFQNTGFCIKANKTSVVSQVLIENIDAQDVHSCILVDRDSEQAVNHWIIKNSRIKGYYRVGIRLAGNQSRDFLLDNVQIDGAHTQGKSECFKSGIQILGSVANVDIRNSSVANNIGTCGEDYQQGDGIEADHKDGTPTNINLDKVYISNSGDAELDLKADHVTMSNIVVQGGDKSRYAFKVWAYKNYECTNCYAHGLHKAYINLNQASMTFHASVFANSTPVHACDLRHGTTPNDQSVVRFDRVQMYLGNEEWINECGAGALSGVNRLPMGRIAPPAPVTNVQAH